MRLGIDFDNTIAGYDRVFREVAIEWGELPGDFQGGKQAVRAALRRMSDGERRWQRLQGRVYGKYMQRAELLDGVAAFLSGCRDMGIEVFVVSHKTQCGHFDPEHIDLHAAAHVWMHDQDLFAMEGVGLTQEQVYFEPTRRDKVRRIADLVCDIFIDDLPEVFVEPGFPEGTRRWLYAPSGSQAEPVAGDFEVFRHWRDMQRELCA